GPQARRRTLCSSTNPGVRCALIRERANTRWSLPTPILPPPASRRGCFLVVYGPLRSRCRQSTKLLASRLRQFLVTCTCMSSSAATLCRTACSYNRGRYAGETPMKSHLCRIALSGLLAAGLTLGSAAAFAQDNPAPDAAAQGGGGRGMGRMQMTPHEKV